MPCDLNKTSSEIEHVDWSNGTSGSGHNYATVRFGSGSSQASQSSGDICRICHCESDPQNPLLTPCYCAGSLKYVHQSCLQQWLTASETNSCELCKFPFIMHTKIKPFNEWRSLDISGIERRRLCCSVLFHCAAALCVIWSLCVLIERAADDVQRGLIDWPFWTKLAVVTVGLTGGVVFMYIQCKAYLHLCHRWKARNRILLIQNAPEKVHPVSPPSPMAHHSLHCHHHEGAASGEARSSALIGVASGCHDLDGAGNSAMVSNLYNNYAPMAAGTLGATATVVEIDGGHQQHHHHHGLSHSHHAQHAHHLHHHHRHHHANSDDYSTSSAPHAEADDIDSMAPRSFADDVSTRAAHDMAVQPQVGQVAVSANIECSQLQQHYERDWALDDVVSQISSFRPCPQGSGSMTPFHDSIHNVLENSEGSTGSLRASVNDVCGGSRQDLSTGGTSTDTGREHGLQLSSYSGSGDHKAPSISSGVSNAVANGLGGFVYKPHTKRYSNSSIFLENRDILNDSGPIDLEGPTAVDYRHSGLLGTPPSPPPDHSVRAAVDAAGRRYSDTKLLASDDATPPLTTTTTTTTNTATATTTTTTKSSNTPTAVESFLATAAAARKHHGPAPPLRKQFTADTVLDMELPTSPLSPLSPPTTIGPHAAPPIYRRSMRSIPTLATANSTLTFSDDDDDDHDAAPHDTAEQPADGGDAELHRNAVKRQQQQQQQQIDKGRLFFQSLPNLSSSCESLIKK